MDLAVTSHAREIFLRDQENDLPVDSSGSMGESELPVKAVVFK